MEERRLDISIRMNEEDFEIDVYEPESGEASQFQFFYSFDEHPEFNETIGNDIYGWIALWKDMIDSEKEDAT